MAKEPKTSDEKDVKTPNAGKKNSVIIDINPTLESVDLLRFNKTAVVAFLKLNPATVEHEELIDHLYDIAAEHGVEEPQVYIQSDSPVPTAAGDSEGSEEDEVVWLDAVDARMIAFEAFGEIVKPETYGYVGELVEILRGKYTHVVLVMSEEDARYHIGRSDWNEVEVVPYGIDEAAIASRMFGYVKADNIEEFGNNIAAGAQFLVDDIIDMYRILGGLTDDEEELGEALTYSQRLKRGQAFRRIKRKVMIARERMRKKIASTDQLKKRARKKAIQAIRKKVAGARGADYQNLGVGEKIQIDKRVEQRKGAIGRIAAKILPQLRKQEVQKISKLHKMHNQHEGFDPSNMPTNIAPRLGDAYPPVADNAPARKVWHQMFDKEGKVKLDRRFKIWRAVASDSDAINAIESVMDDPELATVLETLLVKADEHNVDPAIIRELFDRGMSEGLYETMTPVEEGFQRVNSFLAGSYFIEDLQLMERAEEGACAIISREDLKELEKFADALLDKFGIDIEFTKHFGERMSDDRNNPCITVKELRDTFRKLALTQGKGIKNAREAQVVLKDVQKELNIPVVIDYNRGEFEVTLKTIMRKKNFTTPNPIVRV
ncbi:hypothetical protein PHIM7_355 [Sinorhizobium phage phiM7]|uniref:Uncharacterized protein n=2 Tax=Emdodecavirus TaxID=1980937 RepID=S5MQF5_9CAUD|nr:hypothetical protein AB690_gp159 [Sinorhizobium phage phiM12]YP_009601480.1 hypothetical protein FDH46_gp123 [Sinorhizobium phage phiM7]AGR48090.2 hypothetical protein SmphiM12_458 [Sinorhizobium phage phiM12]AKF12900.1 hypothetical protein PHIM7_355 [Sinorhizobium phage phiM7]AKF13260.1 hypothetical protein PHIM19_355 [Sinorhizobium phage phiM19]